MIIDLDIIKNNIEYIRRIKSEYKFLEKYQINNTHNLLNVGIYDVVNILGFDFNIVKNNIDLNKKIKYVELTKILNESSSYDWTKKTKSNFIKIFKSRQLIIKYFKKREFSSNEPTIVVFLAQNNIEVDPELINRLKFTSVLKKDLNLDRNLPEIINSNVIIDNITNEIKKQNIDIGKCNINYVINIIKDNIRSLILLEKGDIVICNSETDGFTMNKKYDVISSNINYDGILEILIKNDYNIDVWRKYSNFTEIKKFRDNKLSELGLI